MPLRTRITALVMVAVLLLGLLLGAMGWQRDRDLTRRYQDVLLQTQSIAWNKLQSESSTALRAAMSAALAHPDLARAWKVQDRQALSEIIAPVIRLHPGWRADWYDARRELVQSSSSSLQQDTLVDTGWLQRALTEDQAATGFSQASREHYYLVAVQGFGPPNSRGVLAVGQDLSQMLPELAQTLSSQSFLINLRGREIAGTQAGLTAVEGLAQMVRHPRVDEVRGRDGLHWRTVAMPLAGPDARPIGALLSAWDTTVQRRADRQLEWLALGGALLMVAALGWSVFSYLRSALRPLQRSVGVLQALSQGDLRAAPDEDDQDLPDEAGQIARGVSALRGEMINLQMLRDERVRVRQQQERLIRRELRTLASSLDEQARAEVLSALRPAEDDGTGGDDTALVELAAILGRMSGLVVTQQDRLVNLLNQLREAMVQQAALVSLRQELEIARTMQLSILPRTEPNTDAVEVSALMIPAKEVGGDFYDYFLLDGNRLALVVADVSGKGIPAAFFMAISRTLLKSIAQFLREPADIMERLNDRLCAENEQMMFVTAFLGVIDLDSGRLDFVNAGHNAPLLLRGNGQIEVLPQGQNVALAVMDELPFKQGALRLDVGDTLLLYTDGVTEAADDKGELFGEARLLELSRAWRGPPRALPEAVLRAVRAFEAGGPQADDITIVVTSYRGQPDRHASS